jgi:hypothetical protein
VTAPDVTAGDALRVAVVRALRQALTDYSTGKGDPEVDLFDFSADAVLALPELCALIAERDELRAVVARVREIHQPVDYGDVIACGVCEEPGGEVVPWPCETVQALDGTGIATDRPRSDAQGVAGVSGSTRDDETVGDE